MISKWIKKLRSRAGESLAETLAALLVSSLALLMLAGAISAASRVISASETKMGEYYAADNALTEYGAKKGTVTVVLKEAELEQTFSDVPYYVNDTFGGNPTIMYSFEIPTSGES